MGKNNFAHFWGLKFCLTKLNFKFSLSAIVLLSKIKIFANFVSVIFKKLKLKPADFLELDS